MFRRFGTVVLWTVGTFVVMFGLLIVFAQLMGVSKVDVTYKHDMARHVVAEPFEAGDVIAISPDGLSVQGQLCDLDLESTTLSQIPIRARYYNVANEMQDNFFGFFKNAKATFESKQESPSNVVAENVLPPTTSNAAFAPGVPFVGKVSRIVGKIESHVPNSCWCDIAHAILEDRQTACVVEKALVESTISETDQGAVLQRTVGITFRETPINIINPKALTELCPTLNVDAIAPKGRSCKGQTGFTIETRLRSRLIREGPLD